MDNSQSRQRLTSVKVKKIILKASEKQKKTYKNMTLGLLYLCYLKKTSQGPVIQ